MRLIRGIARIVGFMLVWMTVSIAAGLAEIQEIGNRDD